MLNDAQGINAYTLIWSTILLDLFPSIPTTIWSVALGSIIAFGGVLLSNRSNTKRLELQLEHDLKIKSIERKAAMRSEVYLNAAEEIVRANSYLGSLAQLDLTTTNIGDGLKGFFASAAKLGLVAEDNTGKELNELVVAYTCLFLKLLVKISPITKQTSHINIINEHYNDTQIEIKRIITEMTRLSESGEPNDKIFGELKLSLKFQQKRAKELSDERSDCWNKVNEHNKIFTLFLMDELKLITVLQIPVMVGIRKELGIDTDVENYKEIVNSTTERVKSQLDEFLASMSNDA